MNNSTKVNFHERRREDFFQLNQGPSLFRNDENDNNRIISGESSSDGTMGVDMEIEKCLLRDLIYIIQGIDGRYIKYDTKTEQHAIDPHMIVVLSPAK